MCPASLQGKVDPFESSRAAGPGDRARQLALLLPGPCEDRESCLSACPLLFSGLVFAAICGSARTQIGQRGKIFFGPRRRNCPYIECVALEVVTACAGPAAQRLNLEESLRP